MTDAETEADTARRIGRAMRAQIAACVDQLCATDWEDKDAAARTEKRVRVTAALNTLIEKAGMDDGRDDDADGDGDGETISDAQHAENLAQLRRQVARGRDWARAAAGGSVQDQAAQGRPGSDVALGESGT